MKNEKNSDELGIDHNKPGLLTFKIKRPTLNLGQDNDGTFSKLPPYIEIDGIQIHPDHLEEYMRNRKRLKKVT